MGSQIFSLRSLLLLIGGILLSAVFIVAFYLRRFAFFCQKWLQMLIGGLLLCGVAMLVASETGEILFVPVAIVLSAFLVPVVFVTYLNNNLTARQVSIPILLLCFCLGGPLGFLASGYVEYAASQGWTVSGLFGTAFAEESLKLVFPIVIFIGWKYRHETDGLLFGVATGMGFAAVEAMGDALNTYTQSGGLQSMQWVLFYRGLLSPASHAAWTGLICATLWRERERTGKMLGAAGILAFLIAVLLHALWDIIAYAYATLPVEEQTTFRLAQLAIEFLTVTIVGTGLVVWRYRKAREIPETATYETQ